MINSGQLLGNANDQGGEHDGGKGGAFWRRGGGGQVDQRHGRRSGYQSGNPPQALDRRHQCDAIGDRDRNACGQTTQLCPPYWRKYY